MSNPTLGGKTFPYPAGRFFEAQEQSWSDANGFYQIWTYGL